MLSRRSFFAFIAALSPTKVPPPSPMHRIDMERAVIGCLVLSPPLRSSPDLASHHFADPVLRLCYVALSAGVILAPSLHAEALRCAAARPDLRKFVDYVRLLDAPRTTYDMGQCGMLVGPCAHLVSDTAEHEELLRTERDALLRAVDQRTPVAR